MTTTGSSFPSEVREQTELTTGAECVDRDVVVDDNLVSSRKPREISRLQPGNNQRVQPRVPARPVVPSGTNSLHPSETKSIDPSCRVDSCI